jgi:hypothetical protein
MELNKTHLAAWRDGRDEREIAWAAGLRVKYDRVAHPLPDTLLDLLKRLADAESRKRSS